MKEKMPNFFIVGAAKSGTSSLANYLGQHPEVFMSGIKEPFFYADGTGFVDFDEYKSLFGCVSNEKAIGEASTGYLFDVNAPELIKNNHPGAKIIIMLRYPVDMAYSYWQYMQVDGNEDLTFEQAISPEQIAYRHTDEFRGKCKNWWPSYIYLQRAMYSEQVRRYLNVFGKDRVKVIVFEEFIRDPLDYCRDVFGFLGVDASFAPEIKRLNEGGVVRSKLIRDVIYNREYRFLRKVFTPKMRERVRFFVRDLNKTKVGVKRIGTDTKLYLDDYFREDIERLELLLGVEIACWKRWV
jgi:hypothetical protein